MTDLELHTGGRPVEQPRWIGLLPAAAELARQIADTDFVPAAYRRKPAQIAAAVMFGDELGLAPMTSLQKIDVINGNPSPRAEIARALALRAGHEIWTETSNTTRCVVRGRRRDSEHVFEVVFTLDDAKRANLLGKQPWRQHPAEMLFARASARLVRMMAPEVLAGITLFAEEADDSPVEAPAALPAADETPVEQPAKARRRRPAPAALPAADETPGETAAGDVVDVDLDAEPPPVEAPTAPTADAPTAQQMKALHASLGDAGVTERTDRLAFASAAVGRPLESSKDLTRDEVGRVIDAAQQLAGGSLQVTINDDDGSWSLVAAHGSP